MQESVLGIFDTVPAGIRFTKVGQERHSRICNSVYRAAFVDRHLLPLDEAVSYQPLKPVMKGPLGTLYAFQVEEFEQLCPRDKAGSQDLLEQRYVPGRVNVDGPFFVTHIVPT
jgi:hypothetical protein